MSQMLVKQEEAITVGMPLMTKLLAFKESADGIADPKRPLTLKYIKDLLTATAECLNAAADDAAYLTQFDPAYAGKNAASLIGLVKTMDAADPENPVRKDIVVASFASAADTLYVVARGPKLPEKTALVSAVELGMLAAT